jgi:hypothetical protein
MTRALALAPIVLVLGLAGCGGGSSRSGHTSDEGSSMRDHLTDLHSVGQLSSAFNAAPGEPRLVVLMSPT